MQHSFHRYILAGVLFWGPFSALAEVPKLPEPERFYRVPEHLPEWLEGHQNLLPPVDKATIEEMANLLNNIRMIGGGGSPEYAKYEEAVLKAKQRAGELKEKAAHSVLALYTYEDPVSQHTDNMRSQIVEKIWRDPTILEYTLPFFRRRVNYLAEQFRAGDARTTEDTPVGSSELQVLVGYLQTWGDENDKKSLRDLLELMEAKGDYYVSGWAAEAMRIFERNIEAETAEYSSKKQTHKFHIKTSDYLAHGLDQAYALPSSTYKPPAANTPDSRSDPDSAQRANNPKNGEGKPGAAVQTAVSRWGLIGMVVTTLGALVWYWLGRWR